MVAHCLDHLSSDSYGLSLQMTSPVADKSSADGLAAFPGEVPLQSQLKQWIEDFQSTHSGAFSAAFAGMEPMFMIDFNPFPMTSIPPLILDAANGVTAQMVQKRDDTILEKTFHNQQQALKANYAYAQYRNMLFSKIEISLRKSAPLLLQKLKDAHPIPGCAGMYFGDAAWQSIKDMQNTGNAFDHLQHDNVLSWMQVNPVPDDIHPDTWAARINVFRRNHWPHLERPMTALMLGKFILNQLPSSLAADKRLLLNTLTDDQLSNSTSIIEKCMNLLRQLNPLAQPPSASTIIAAQSLSIMAATFFRPKDLTQPKSSNGSGSGGGTGGGTGGRSKGGTDAVDVEKLYKNCHRKCCRVKHKDGDECCGRGLTAQKYLPRCMQTHSISKLLRSAK